jgi:2'-5' RNA ligase
MRLFIAVELDDAVRAELGRLLAELRRAGGPVKWVRPENLHLTLKFLGEVADARAGEAAEVTRDCAAGVAPFRLAVRGVGGFPDLKRPRVVFAGAEAERGAAQELARRLNEGMQLLDVPPEEREFQCHITLARLREPRPAPRLTAALEGCAGRSFGALSVGYVTLMRSTLTPAGPVYEAVERVALTATGAGSGESRKELRNGAESP